MTCDDVSALLNYLNGLLKGRKTRSLGRMVARQTPSARRYCLPRLAYALVLLLFIASDTSFAAAPLTSLDYRISGTILQVSPPVLSVPKGIPGSVLVSLVAGGSTNNAASAQFAVGTYVQAVIRGPGFPTPQRIVGPPNAPLLLPPINLVGDYELDGIALVDSVTGQVKLEGVPSTVPVHVFDQILISSVTSQPLTLDQIEQAGIAIDESNFRAVQFNVSFVLDGQTIPITFPVVSPTFTDSTELIPADEVEARLKQAAVINQQIASTIVQLPPELQTSGLNIQVQGLNFQVADPGEPASLGLAIPPIPALMVIPGNIGYLHQFFGVKIFTENGAPTGSGLSVDQVTATLSLPPGPSGIVSTNWAEPGDNPLRFARLGPNKVVQPSQPVVDPGADGQLGTGDDISQLQPAETGQAEFYVEGLQEGLWVMDVDLTANLYGLAAGVVGIKGKAAGSVLVRNPSFSLTFTHPDVVRVGEPYDASITILNTGVSPANLVSVSLNKNSISGAILAPNQPETVQLGTILPGQVGTATYHLIAQRTGQIKFSDLTTSDNSLVGRFRFTMGVDAQGVPLSPDTIAMPDFVNYLPPDLVAAANRVLGQALSIATAAQLPAGIARVGNAIITRRVLDLAEAGQRVEYGDPLSRVLPDLLRDWQGGRVADDGFDALLRTSDAGAQWRSVLFGVMERADGFTGTARLTNRAPDLAGLGQSFVVASAGPGQLRADFTGGTNSATTEVSSQTYAEVYAATNGEWAVTPYVSNTVFTWTFTNAPASADLGVLLVGTNGQAQQLRWQISQPPVTAIYRFALADSSQRLQIDDNGDGVIDRTLVPSTSIVTELPPTLVAVQQDLGVLAGRPSPACVGPDYGNYGTVVAVVYSKPITQATAGATNSYTVEGDNGANSVQVQPSGRVALLNLRKGISAIIPRRLTVSGVTDVRGNALPAVPTPIVSHYPGTTNLFTGGVAVTGRVLKGDGSPAIHVPVTLTMYDGMATPTGCEIWIRRVSQVLTDSGGNFGLDFVMSGIPYSISASDTSGLPPGALSLTMQSTLGEKPDTQQLQQIINAAANPNNLLGLLTAGSLPQAVAIVEGLDRALLHDVVGIGTGREGQTVPFILRFRGRGTVTGQVVGVDGITPVPNAAVNLYPDPSSRELGRGVFSDGSGQFAFAGIPLGVFSVQVATSDHRSATVLGVLDSPGETTNVVVSLPTNIVLSATLRGQVFDSDNVTPVPNARVVLGQLSGDQVQRVVNIVDADTGGAWQATNVPVQQLDVVALNFDGTRRGARLGIVPVGGQITYVNVSLQAATTVFGQVLFDDGRPATNALVAGGAMLVRTDTKGNFQLEGVPIGTATISAGLERNPAAGIAFPRLGNTTTTIVAGQANYVVVKLRPAGRIFGKVFDAQGNVKPNIRVAIPQEGGFYWTDADTNGNYVFENLGLGRYTLSAPANAVAPQLNTSQLSEQLSSGDEAQILAAFNEAITVFIGANDPLINGDQLNFRPSTWGYTKASIPYDGADVNADIHFIVQGTVSGRVLNPQGVPIGARVRLTGIGPDITGNPVMTVRGDTDSSPATGAFGFTNVLLAGPWGLQAASPFYPVVIQTNGFTTQISPDANGIVLQFPPLQDINGSIAGHVFNPDGSPVGEGAQVHINVSSDYQIQTDTNGYFNTQIEFPALGRGYTVEVFDPSSGLKGRAGISMTPGITNVVDVHLLSRNSSIQVTVIKADGQPASGALLQLDQGTYPNDAPLFGATDTNGVALFDGLWEGSYSVLAQFTEQATRLFARSGGSVGPNSTIFLTLRLGATGSIVGTFLTQDRVTPVFGAEVAIGDLGFATTATNGFFEFDGVPLGTYRISSSDPVTGGNAVAFATLSFNGQTQSVQLIEATLGTVSGLVLDPYSSGFVAGASVNISFSDGVTPNRTVTTGPNGAFNFPGSPMGAFSLHANYQLPGTLRQTVSGTANGILSPATTNTSVNIQLQPLTYLAVHVVHNDGITPALNARVSVGSQSQDTSTNGDVAFSNLSVPATYSIFALSQQGGDLFDAAGTNVTLVRGTNPVVTLVLPGVGNIAGTVFGSDGATPVTNAQITLQFQGPFFFSSKTALSDDRGRFSFTDVPMGPFVVSASSASLAASENSSITTAGETNEVSLRLGASGSLVGIVVRADGLTPVANVDVSLEYTSQSLNAGHAVYFTGLDGSFRFDNIPVGPIHVSSAAPDFGGIISFDTELLVNGEVLNLGVIPFDEDLPAVVRVTPADTTIDVPITNVVDLLFSEALDTNSIDPTGVFIRDASGNVPSTVSLLADTNGVQRLVRIRPTAPLKSTHVYTVIVLSGDLPGPTGGIIGSGPRDLVGRTLAAPFESHFATADNTPPQLLSIFPSNNAVQIDPSAVPRLAFDKTLQPTGFAFVVSGPSGIVPGAAAVGINGQVVSFVPTTFLQANAKYSMVVSNVFDLAGNRAAGEAFRSSFATVDTVGPTITTLRIASNAVPAGGALIPVEAVLSTNEPGASVRFTADFNPVATATNPPYQAMVRLPQTGSTTVRAIATDEYGNDGPFAPLTITVQPPLPPTLQFTLVSPTNGPLPTGSAFIVDVTGSADTGISNLTALAGGAATGALLSTNGAQLRVQGLVPTNAIAGQPVQIFAQVTDNLGLSSGQQVLTLTTIDKTPPGLAILGPTNSAVFNAGSLLSLITVTSDNSSNLTLNLLISGSISATQTLTTPLIPNQSLTNLFAVTLTNGSPLGGPFTASLSATDSGGNSTSVTRTFQLRGPPPTVQIVRVSPATGPVPTASVLVLDVFASGGNGIAQLRADVTGAITNSTTTNRSSIRLQLPVPPGALAGQSVHIAGQATDSLGQASSPITLDLVLSDGTPPNLVVSGPTNDTLFLTGQELDLSTITSDNSSNAALSLVLSGSVSATQSRALALAPGVSVTNLFAFPLTNVSPLGGPFTAVIMAIDGSSNTAVVTRTFQLKGPGPTLEFSRVSPTAGPVPSGSNFSIRINAVGGNGISSFSASLSGAVTNGPFTTLGTTLLVQALVPPTTVTGQEIRLTAEAVDALGRSSGVQVFTLSVSDGTPPSIAILGPPEGTRLNPSQPLGLTVFASDNSTNVNLDLAFSGSLVSTQVTALALTPNSPVTNLLVTPLTNAFLSGGLLTATVTARDGTGNAALATRNFWLPPLATSLVTWDRQALGQTFNCTNGAGSYTWPNNNNWSQSTQFGAPCQPGQIVEIAPSNWSTTNYPSGGTNDVMLGNLGGAPANLDVSVAVNSLTILSNGGLNLQLGRTLTANAFDFQGDSGITVGGGGGPAPVLVLTPGGTLTKSAGTGLFAIDPRAALTSVAGVISVQSGTLALPGSGSSYSNVTFAAAAGASLDLVPTNMTASFAGQLAGSGSGQVQLNYGALIGFPAVLNFAPGLFQWTGGQMNSILTNAGTIALVTTNNHQLWDNPGISGTDFSNAGLVQHVAGTLDLQSQFVKFHNLPSGIYAFTGDGSIMSTLWSGTGTFDNYGVLRKNGGTNSFISVPLNNFGGNIELTSGSLTLSGGGTSSNGTVSVAANTVLNFTGGATWNWSGALSGSGAGQIRLNDGALVGTPLTLNFAPGVFQWVGDRMNRVITNIGTVTLVSTNIHRLWDNPGISGTEFYNSGTVLHIEGSLDLQSRSANFHNLPSGVYELTGDGDILSTLWNGAGTFENAGTVRKSGGANSVISVPFINLGGTIEVDSGTLTLTGGSLAQNGGALKLVLGGRGPGQFGQLVISNSVSLSGSLNVTLASGFVPTPGDQFPLLMSTSLSGKFDQVSVPAGGFLYYTNNTVSFVFSGQSNLPPSLQFSIVTPTNGAAPSGAGFEVDVHGSDDNGIGRITANLGGVLTNTFTTNGSDLRIVGVVPASAVPGEQLRIAAQVFDEVGQSTGPQFLTLPISDGTPPAAAILSPAANTMLALGQQFSVTGFVSDNSTNVTLTLALFGSMTATQSVARPLIPNTPLTNLFTIPLSASSPGGLMTAALIATDTASNTTTAVRNYFLPPSTPISISWQDWSANSFASSNAYQVELDGAFSLNTSVMIDSLTFHPGSTLNMMLNGPGSSISARNFFFQGDGSITRSGCCSPTVLNLDGGTMEKLGGTNAFVIDPGVVLNSLNGTIAVDVGVLALPGNNSTYTDGSFRVASNATLNLVPSGNTANFGGTFGGEGPGTVLMSAGTLNAAPGGVTFNLPPGLFQWTGGMLLGNNPLTNAGTLTVAGTGGTVLGATLNNAGLLLQSNSGDLNLYSAGPGAHFENLDSGTYLLQSDSGISSVGCCSPTIFDNFGLFQKAGGVSNSVISVPFNNIGGTVDVETGTLTLANDGTSSSASLMVATGATLDITGGRRPTWSGQMNGLGSGTVLLSSGILVAGPDAALNFVNGLFHWAGGTLQGPFTNLQVVSVIGDNPSFVSSQFENVGLLRHQGIGSLAFNEPGPGAHFDNLPGATYQLENDGGMFVNGCCSATVFSNWGLLRKSGGTNESRIDTVLFDNLGGSIEVETGRLTFANNGSSSNATITVAGGALLDLTGGRSPTWGGTMTGTGNGRIELNSGEILANPSLTLNTSPGLFQWTGGEFSGSVLNINELAISGSSDVLLSGVMTNLGTLVHSGPGNFAFGAPGPGAHFENLASGVYRLESGAGIYISGCCTPVAFDNFGLFTKVVSASNSVISVPFNNLGGLVDVETGSLTLANSGVSVNATLNVAAGGLLDISGGAQPSWSGRMNGIGSGTVLLGSGTLNATPSVSLDFTNGLFQWKGGTLGGLTTNLNVLVLSDVNDRILSGELYNAGLMRHNGAGRLGLNAPGAGTHLHNLPGGVYQFETDSSIFINGCCSGVGFLNEGLLRKLGGTGTTTISAPFSSLSGTVEVDAGQLTLANSGSSSNGNFVVAAGAAVDLTGGAQPSWTGRLAGTGTGRLQLAGGQILASALTLDCAPGLFQWSGGTFNGSVTNANEVDLLSGAISGGFYNRGLLRHSGTAALALNAPGAGSQFYNFAGGEYRFEGDGTIASAGCCSATAFNNFGLLHKSAGTNSVISVPFNNLGGSLQIDVGTLVLANGGFAQSNGLFGVGITGRTTGQFGRLTVSGGVTLSGPLVVTLAGGFKPSLGDQFQILSGSSINGTFSSVSLPAGFDITYGSASVTLTVTNTTLVTPLVIAQPRGIGANFRFSFRTLNGQNYVVERSDDLSQTNWVFYANILGNGSDIEVSAPATNSTRRFFRVRMR